MFLLICTNMNNRSVKGMNPILNGLTLSYAF